MRDKKQVPDAPWRYSLDQETGLYNIVTRSGRLVGTTVDVVLAEKIVDKANDAHDDFLLRIEEALRSLKPLVLILTIFISFKSSASFLDVTDKAEVSCSASRMWHQVCAPICGVPAGEAELSNTQWNCMHRCQSGAGPSDNETVYGALNQVYSKTCTSERNWVPRPEMMISLRRMLGREAELPLLEKQTGQLTGHWKTSSYIGKTLNIP